MQDDTQPPVLTPKQKLRQWLKRHYKMLLIIFGAIIVALIAITTFAGGTIEKYISQTALPNYYSGTLLSSLENTLKLEQLKFQSEFQRHSSGVNAYGQNLKVDGAYKKDAGLSATVASDSKGTGTEFSQGSQWVIDKAGNTYITLTSFTTKTTADSTVQTTPAMNEMVKRIVDNNNKKNKDVWTKYSNDRDLLNTYNITGLNGCSLKAFYNTQSNYQDFLGSIKRLAQNASVQKNDSKDGIDTYTVTALADRGNDTYKLYTDSKLYKWLVGCNAAEYTLSQQSAASILKKLTVTIKVDAAKKLISSVAVKNKDKYDFKLTIAEANDVTISIPKVAEPVMTIENTSMEKVLEEYPYDYEHMQDGADILKNGACSTLDKYRHLASPEVIEICEKGLPAYKMDS